MKFIIMKYKYEVKGSTTDLPTINDDTNKLFKLIRQNKKIIIKK